MQRLAWPAQSSAHPCSPLAHQTRKPRSSFPVPTHPLGPRTASAAAARIPAVRPFCGPPAAARCSPGGPAGGCAPHPGINAQWWASREGWWAELLRRQGRLPGGTGSSWLSTTCQLPQGHFQPTNPCTRTILTLIDSSSKYRRVRLRGSLHQQERAQRRGWVSSLAIC